MRDKLDSRKKRFIEALTLEGTVYHASKAAGVSRQAAYRWRHEDLDFADLWDEAIENAVDAVESTTISKQLAATRSRGSSTSRPTVRSIAID